MKKKISKLKITSNDKWKDKWIDKYGTSVSTSPEYYYYQRDWHKIGDWVMLTKIHRVRRMDLVLESIKEWGQIKPIVVTKDLKIVTGHKRAAAMVYLGFDMIEVEYND